MVCIHNRVNVPPWYCHSLLVRAWFNLNSMTGTGNKNIWGSLKARSWVWSRYCSGNTTVFSATRFGADQACCWNGRTKDRTWHLNSIIHQCYILPPLLEAIVAYTNPLPLFSGILRIIRWDRHRICSTLCTENPPTETTMVSTVENCKLRITFIAYPTTMVRHPKIPWNICWLRPPRHPWLH